MKKIAMIVGSVLFILILVYLAILFTGIGDVQVYKSTHHDITGKAKEKYHHQKHAEKKALLEQLKNLPQTTVEVDSIKYHFGNIPSNEKQHHTYILKNTGDNPLIIKDVQVSCGCTVSEYSKEPTKPGENAEVSIVFDPESKEGHTEKALHVYANIDPNPMTLGFVADIESTK